MDQFLGKKEGAPFTGANLAKLKEFLAAEGLDYDEGIDYSLVLLADGQIIATGSLQANVLKCIAVASEYQGQGLLAQVITALIYRLTQQGLSHYFLFTKESNRTMFRDMSFYEIATARGILLMENRRNGIAKFVKQLQTEQSAAAFADSGVGAIVANCNPFTRGHQYLMETAAKQCEQLHVFILAQNNQSFTEAERFAMVSAGTRHISKLIVHQASDYLVSPATFPTYFIKEKGTALEDNCILDLTVFVKYIAPALGITKRFVGTEPYCPVTSQYNECMRWFLPENGIEFVEISRLEDGGGAISASRVRAGLQGGASVDGGLAEVLTLLPDTSWAVLGQVTVEDMLLARERRVEIQQCLLAQHPTKPLVCFTLNIPGPLKVSRGIYQVYQEGVARIEKALSMAGLTPVGPPVTVAEKTGLEYHVSLAAEAGELKRLMTDLEEEDAIARLFDIDIITPNGQKVGRSELGLPERSCLLCDEPAHACGRSRRHSLDELTIHIEELIRKFGEGKQACQTK